MACSSPWPVAHGQLEGSGRASYPQRGRSTAQSNKVFDEGAIRVVGTGLFTSEAGPEDDRTSRDSWGCKSSRLMGFFLPVATGSFVCLLLGFSSDFLCLVVFAVRF